MIMDDEIMLRVDHHGVSEQEYFCGVAKIVLAMDFPYRRTLMEIAACTPEKFEKLANEVIRQNCDNKAKGISQ